jgi:hypothetical protein
MADDLKQIAGMLGLDVSVVLKQQLRNLALYAAAAFFAAVALAAALGGLGVFLAERYGGVAAFLIVAALALAICVLLLAVVAMMRRSDRQLEQARSESRRAALMLAQSVLPGRGSALVLALLLMVRLAFGMTRKSTPEDPPGDKI